MRDRIVCCVILMLCAIVVRGIAPTSTSGEIVINEVAWGGMTDQTQAEWIELCNPGEEAVDVTGWRLVSSDGSPDIMLSGAIFPRSLSDPTAGYYLLERNSDEAAPGVPADQIYAGALSDAGETLFLYDVSGELVDTANASLDPDARPLPWAAGSGRWGNPPYRTMERLDPRAPDLRTSWASFAPSIDLTTDTTDASLLGSPKGENSVFNLVPTGSFRVHPPMPRPEQPATLDAGPSFDPNNAIDRYVWDFGDGSTGEGLTATHTYLVPGEYAVRLIVTDEKGGRDEIVETITVVDSTPPVADFSVFPPEGRRVLRSIDTIRFQDESYDADGELLTWAWSFGDGETSSLQTPTHAYRQPGAYVILLEITDQQGDTDISAQTIHIANQPPIAALSSPDAGFDQHAPARFDAGDSTDVDGEVVSYLWDFDDDDNTDLVTAEPVAEYAFATWGSHSVSVVAVDDLGHASLPASLEITVNAVPVAQFEISVDSTFELEEVRFTSRATDPDGEIASYAWNFGDGATSAEVSPTHTYRASGTYTVALTVRDHRGQQHTASANLAVENLPPTAVLASGRSESMTGDPIHLDASGSTDCSPTGSIARYEWDLGDGEFSQETTEPHFATTFADDGTRDVRVRVTDNLGAVAVSDPVRITITNRAPQVRSISWTPRTPTDADPVVFSSKTHDDDGTVTAWSWTIDCGTPSSSTQDPVTVSFCDDGTYEIRLLVRDNDGAISQEGTVSVHVSNAPPVASFEVSQTSADPPTLRFDASATYDPSPTGRIAHMGWDFGDGTTCPGDCQRESPRIVLHQYAEPGTYEVTLTVLDDQGALHTVQQIVSVHD